VVEEDEGKCQDEPAPEAQEASDQSDEGAERGEVTECFTSEETGESILFERFEDVDFLCVEQIGNEG
jgi:hypothetical protein